MSANEDHSDTLVQWCHGATGFVYLFLRAYEVNRKENRTRMSLVRFDRSLAINRIYKELQQPEMCFGNEDC